MVTEPGRGPGRPTEGDEGRIDWAPRASQAKIRRLYQTDALGIYDEELIDDVGYALWARCESFVLAVDAARGRATCPRCGCVIAHTRAPDEVLRCDGCGWETTWRTYFKSFQHKQLSGADPVLELFRDFMRRFPAAPTPREKMLLIDRLIHGFHWSLRYGPTRPVGVNLIEGNLHEVVEFLDSLSYGDGSTPSSREHLATWRDTINTVAESWGDQRLRRSAR